MAQRGCYDVGRVYERHWSIMTNAVILSERAAERIKAITEADGKPAMLRVSVDGGGCSGFQYRFELVEKAAGEDTIVECNGARLVIDQMSLLYLAGSEVDFFDELAGASFRVDNPNAVASCGCGTSFSI